MQLATEIGAASNSRELHRSRKHVAQRAPVAGARRHHTHSGCRAHLAEGKVGQPRESTVRDIDAKATGAADAFSSRLRRWVERAHS